MIFDNWNDWFQAEKKNISKEFADFVIHPAGLDGQDEWLRTGKENAIYTIDELELKKAESVMEYGCGNGRILRWLENYNAYGVDIVPDFVEEANSLGCRAFLLEDFTECVDKVYSLTVFIHLRHSQAETALRYIHDHLKDGGKAYIQALVYEKDKDAKNFSDMTSYTPDTWKSLCEKCGFNVITMWENKGDIDEGKYGANHNKYHILEKC